MNTKRGSRHNANPAASPRLPDAMAGQQIFLAGPCSMCHQVRGTVAGGRVAPDLTHIGSRKLIAANSISPITMPISKPGSRTLSHSSRKRRCPT